MLGIPSPPEPRPEIHLAESVYERVEALALSLERHSPALARTILEEIERAEIHADDDLPETIVSIGSEVEFVDECQGTARRVTLVLPAEADIEAGKVSIMTSVGAGLIGLAEGQSIDWPCPDGRDRRLKIKSVRRRTIDGVDIMPSSGDQGGEKIDPEDDEVNGALKNGRAPGRQRQRRNDEGQEEKDDALAVEAESDRKPDPEG